MYERGEDRMTRSEELYRKAGELIPGGVNSPVRAFRSVGMDPRFIKRARGSRIWDVDENEYIDLIGSWGPMIMGHGNMDVLEAVQKAIWDGLSFGAATEKEGEIAELITSSIPSVELIRMVNSGTEAVMSAIRLARGFTGRDKIIKFQGCYHGHSDSMLVKAGSGAMTQGTPDSAGVPVGVSQDTLTAQYNNLNSLEQLFEANKDNIAAVIVEPVAANMGVVLPEQGFLSGIKALCEKHGALLIFDEVITGFRLAFGGAQEYFGIEADIVTYGKIIGGGMPVGAYGGRKDIMKKVAPLGPVYQAGTLSGNPIAMAAGLAQLKYLRENDWFYGALKDKGDSFFKEVDDILNGKCIAHTLNHISSLGSIFFTDKAVRNYEDAKTSDTDMFASFFRHMLDHGVLMAPSQFEAIFLSGSHGEEELKAVLKAVNSFKQQ